MRAPFANSPSAAALCERKASRGSSRGSMAAKLKPPRQLGRQLLHRMHREIDGAAEQCFLDLFGEESLAARIRQCAVQNTVAGGGQRHNFRRHASMCLQGARHEIGLRPGKPGAARADAERDRVLRHGAIRVRRTCLT